MGSKNLRGSTSFAKDGRAEGSDSDAENNRRSGPSRSAEIKRITARMFRAYWDSGIKTLENMTGRAISAESKRKMRLSVINDPTFEYRIKRTVAKSLEERMEAAEPVIAESIMDIALPEEMSSENIEIETVTMLDMPEAPTLLPPVSMKLDEPEDVLVEADIGFEVDGMDSSFDAVEGDTANSPIEASLRTPLVETAALTSSAASEMGSMNPFPFEEEAEYTVTEIEEPVIEIEDEVELPVEIDDGVDYEELYEDIAAYEIVDEVMPRIVPEVFDLNYGKFVPEYVISEIAEPATETTVIDVPVVETVAPVEAHTVNVTNVTTFRFAFASTLAPGKTGFTFTFGRPAKKTEETVDYDDTPVQSRSEATEATVFAVPPCQ